MNQAGKTILRLRGENHRLKEALKKAHGNVCPTYDDGSCGGCFISDALSASAEAEKDSDRKEADRFLATINRKPCCEECGALLENKSAARLIAAAPELLEVLRRYIELPDTHCRCSDAQVAGQQKPLCVRCEARAAIAKAEGRQP